MTLTFFWVENRTHPILRTENYLIPGESKLSRPDSIEAMYLKQEFLTNGSESELGCSAVFCGS
jgi:hypothetical protein